MVTVKTRQDSRGKQSPASIYRHELADDLRGSETLPQGSLKLGDRTIEMVAGRNSLWVVVRRPGLGGLALRAVFLLCRYEARVTRSDEATLGIRIDSALGRHEVELEAASLDLHRLRLTVRFTPVAPMRIPYQPRDLYPLDADDDPAGSQGSIEAAQRGINSGLLFFNFERPAFGHVLYFQNLTGLNAYLRATGTTPSGAVGGEWPEIGMRLPTDRREGTGEPEPLPAGETVTLSDAIVVMRDSGDDGEADSARLFLQMLGAVYRALDLPDTQYRDWIDRSERTLADLETAPEATIRHYGNLYIHPYTASEYPDVMVQMSVLASIHDYGRWRGKPHRLEARLKRGLDKFYDAELGTMRRYLPNVGKDKDKDAVDSWYLYHPLLNLGRLAIAGDKHCARLFEQSLDYAIRAARHFRYCWPIQYNVRDFSIITATAADDRGQTDVGGIYAYVMLQAHQLSGKTRYLDEARKAIDAATGLRFDLNYQANLSAWGAAACMRLWRITSDDRYRDQSYVYLASFFHNSEIWKSEIGTAREFDNFLAVTCLQDAPYMAIYECFDSFAAFENYLADSGPDLEPAARLLVAEYCKYALHRAWYYYPDTLPEAVLAKEQRNGHIDRKLSFPLEDLYADGQPAGQVGQEIYGCGAAFIFATRSHMNVDGAPFRLFCDHFIRTAERSGTTALSIQIDGGETCWAKLCVLPLESGGLPPIELRTADGEAIRAGLTEDGRIEFLIPANGRVILGWQ